MNDNCKEIEEKVQQLRNEFEEKTLDLSQIDKRIERDMGDQMVVLDNRFTVKL